MAWFNEESLSTHKGVGRLLLVLNCIWCHSQVRVYSRLPALIFEI